MNTPADNHPVNVRILDRDYLIACEPHERDGLIRAAAMLDGQMRDIRRNASTATPDRIAVLAALNLAHELTQIRNQKDDQKNDLSRGLTDIHRKLDRLLELGLR